MTRASVTCTYMNSEIKFPQLEKIKVYLDSQSTFYFKKNLFYFTVVKSDCVM